MAQHTYTAFCNLRALHRSGDYALSLDVPFEGSEAEDQPSQRQALGQVRTLGARFPRLKRLELAGPYGSTFQQFFFRFLPSSLEHLRLGMYNVHTFKVQLIRDQT